VKKTLYKRVNTPFGYFGSKNKIAFQICKSLPPHACWVEAFCGSAAVTLAKPPAPIEVINDVDSQIVNIFEQLRYNEAKLVRAIMLTPYAREELIKARKKTTGLSNLERARRFLVASMMSINGVFGPERGGFSYSLSYTRNGKEARVSRWTNLSSRLEMVVERLRNARIENIDARKLLRIFENKPATLIYLDPPYFADRTNGYDKDETSEKFHRELLTIAQRSKCMILVSGYENDLYNSLLTSDKGWSKKSIKTHTKDSKGKMHKRTEVLWMNQHFVGAKKSGKIPVEYSKKELIQGKVNPSR
jgi:DNA adenine methylase